MRLLCSKGYYLVVFPDSLPNIDSVLDTETGNIELYGNSVSVGGNVCR